MAWGYKDSPSRAWSSTVAWPAAGLDERMGIAVAAAPPATTQALMLRADKDTATRARPVQAVHHGGDATAALRRTWR